MTIDEFRHWLHGAKPGDVISYYRTNGVRATVGEMAPRLAREALYAAGYKPQRSAPGSGVHLPAWADNGDARVHLVQRKHGPDDFEYLAVRR